MAIILKSKEERAKIRETGRIVAEILAELRNAVHPGITTAEIDKLCREALARRGAKSSSLGYHGYPASLCTSVNDEVVHGIPGERVLAEGDIITLDLAASYNGWHADSAITVPVGTVKAEDQQLLKVTEDALYQGIAAARAGNHLQDIGRTVQQFVEAAGYSVVRQYGGHGVGRHMHEDPQVLNYVERGYPNYILKPGMVFAIEPMVIMGKKETQVLADDWTVISADHSMTAHFEHTIAVTTGDAEILTL
ncbi:type I methionyl aminopeptidase [Ktedonosporobacter rubrisoli]|uniref:Methionine aminopeptidase n=1 Tax=Ktedonosporobacter rubrisoli TaxID=2509675 RepID=A0A4P6JWM4_KTERU|nr:type I methionyl aminopeptidase [Ktedonosporobacter rubrisoli]QBD80108.1 type I methionyl aminopeptidase [Ktedonosporobacter rubrisoli]